MNDSVNIVEVGLRDGLQNEPHEVSPKQRSDWFNRMARSGLRDIEAGSFVSPRWVPQMAGTESVIQGIERRDGVNIHALVPNQKGLDAALNASVDTIAIFTAASDAFNRKNINCTIEESLERFRPVIDNARKAGLRIRAYVSCVVACPYAGPIAPAQVAEVTGKLLHMGAAEVSLGDTIGVARPRQIHALLDAVLDITAPEHIALHCHDTYGQALANIAAGLERDIRIFDSAVAGLGGCPYAKGASGNVATEDVLYLMEGQGLKTGVDLPQIAALGEDICHMLGRPNRSRAGTAIAALQRNQNP